MKILQGSVLLLMGWLMTGCQEDALPEISLDGHWIIDHGFYEDCQVGVTITEDVLVFTLHNLAPAACWTEEYGIENGVLIFQIDQRTDYYAEDGARAVDLEAAYPEESIRATATLWETETGLRASIPELVEPTMQLQILQDRTYDLELMSETWLPEILGLWGAPCDELYGGIAGEICPMIQFDDVSHGRGYVSGGTCDTNQPGAEPNCGDVGEWENFTYALRHVEQSGEDTLVLDIAILFMQSGVTNVFPFELHLAAGDLTLHYQTAGDPATIVVPLTPMTDE